MASRPGGVVATALAAILPVVASACSHSSATPPPTTVAQTPGTSLARNQAVIDGTVSTAHFIDVVTAPIDLPITITVPVRGAGGLNIDGVISGGQRTAIGWDAGQPLPITGTGSIDLGAVSMDIDTGGINFDLDNMPRYLQPGRYLAESDVAIGYAGLATPVPNAEFTVAPGTIGDITTTGGATIHLALRPMALTGPGVFSLTGTFSMQTATGTTTVQEIHFGPGAFQLRLTAAGRVSGLIQGPFSDA